MTERRAELVLALTTVFWSGTFVFTKYALADCDPVYFVSLRFFVATLVSVVLWRAVLGSITLPTLRDGIILGLLYGCGFLLQTWGLQYTTISKSAFITGMVVIFIPAADWFVRRKRLNLVHGIAVVIAGVGLLLLTHPEWDFLNYGDVMTLGASVLWSFYISFLDKSSTKNQELKGYTEQLVSVQFGSTLLIALLAHAVYYMFSSDVSSIPTHHSSEQSSSAFTMMNIGSMSATFSSSLVIAVLYTALLGSLASTYLQTKYQRFVSPVKAGIIFTLEPIFATGIAYFTHHDRLSVQEICGAVIMICAIIFADLAPSAKAFITSRLHN